MSIPQVLKTISAALLLLGFAWSVAHAPLALGLTFTSAILAMALDRGIQALNRIGIPRGIGIALLLLTVLSLATGAIAIVGPKFISQIRYAIAFIPQALDSIQETSWFVRLAKQIDLAQQLEQLRQQIPSYLSTALNTAFDAVFRLLSWILFAVTIFFLTTFMLIFGRSFLRRILEQALPWRRERYRQVLQNIHRTVGGYIAGLALIVLINTTITATFLAILRIPLFLLLGLLSGISSILPIVGPMLAGLTVSSIALIAGGRPKAAGVLIFFIIYQQLENQVIGPLIYRKTARINPLALAMGLLFFSELYGVSGAVLSVPAIAIAQVLYLEAVKIRTETNIEGDQPSL